MMSQLYEFLKRFAYWRFSVPLPCLTSASCSSPFPDRVCCPRFFECAIFDEKFVAFGINNLTLHHSVWFQCIAVPSRIPNLTHHSFHVYELWGLMTKIRIKIMANNLIGNSFFFIFSHLNYKSMRIHIPIIGKLFKIIKDMKNKNKKYEKNENINTKFNCLKYKLKLKRKKIIFLNWKLHSLDSVYLYTTSIHRSDIICSSIFTPRYFWFIT